MVVEYESAATQGYQVHLPLRVPAAIARGSRLGGRMWL